MPAENKETRHSQSRYGVVQEEIEITLKKVGIRKIKHYLTESVYYDLIWINFIDINHCILYNL